MIHVKSQQRPQPHIQPGLLTRLAYRPGLGELLGIQKTTGDIPIAFVRFPGAMHEQYLALAHDQNAGAGLVIVIMMPATDGTEL